MTLTPVLSPLHSDCALSIWTQTCRLQLLERQQCPPIPGSITQRLDLLSLLRILQVPSVCRSLQPPSVRQRFSGTCTTSSAPAPSQRPFCSCTRSLVCNIADSTAVVHCRSHAALHARFHTQRPPATAKSAPRAVALCDQRCFRFTTHQAPTLPNNHGSEVQTASATDARATPRRFCSLQ